MKQTCEQSADWLMIAALDTEDFFRNPDIRQYERMMISAEQAGIADSIRPIIMAYVQEGTFPSSATKESVIPGIPPDAGMTYGRRYAPLDAPLRPLLLEIALIDKDPDVVLEWYVQIPSG
ncbi:MAG: hypothetical protein JXA44_08675 [Methanospirillaceae archaeon]|nr:hypothetical protein [Methanospirillaceae archaeon]